MWEIRLLVFLIALPGFLVWVVVLKTLMERPFPVLEAPPGGPVRYPLAPMDNVNLLSTLAVALIVPAIVLLGPALLLGIWFLWRPLRFELGASGLRVVWPLRSRSIGVNDLRGAELLDRTALKTRFGTPMRFGAGGFCGGFGLGIASQQTFAMYVSRIDRFVVVWLASARPLLITPANPEGFVQHVQGLASRPLA
jgi:hypothetical protein